MQKEAATSTAIHPLLAGRWSPISFDPAAELDDQALAALAEAARWAPSCYGAEPWAFVLCPRQDQDAWDRALACLAAPNQAWARDASLLCFAAAATHFPHNGKPNRHHLYDTGAAALSLVLQAEALGLRAHQMGGFDAAAAAEAFGVPASHVPIAAIAVGRQAAAAALADERMREREGAERRREELGSRFFRGGWGEPLAG